jgi:hypothetical protein
MKIEFHVQDPNLGTLYAVDAIAGAAEGASHGCAVFAFATVAGVDLLLERDSIRDLTKSGQFELIVGIDAITNRDTLEHLRDIAQHRKGLHPKVFWNSTTGLFHPKFCHFWSGSSETLMVGSGNLTPRGLRDSYEAFMVVTGKPTEVRPMRKVLQTFLDAHASDIRDIDAEALARASKNTFVQPIAVIEQPGSQPTKKGSQPSTKKSKATQLGTRVLVAELPRGGARWQQANFDYNTASNYFGIDPSDKSLHNELFFNEVDGSGTGVSEEVRRFTFTRSKNLRVQLGAKKGVDYPSTGRPIAVFREVKSRHFIYQLLIPGEKGFAKMKAFLGNAPKGSVRREETSVNGLRAAWPDCPLC